MPEQVGKIIRTKNRFPGPPFVTVNTVGEGLRKHINLCFACSHFKPNEAGHCKIAQELFEFGKHHGIGTALVRCAHFESAGKAIVQNSVKEEE
jgi:hypothetical protein